MNSPFKYTGEKLANPVSLTHDKVVEEINPYIPNQELIKAVNLALLLERPLLLMGQPGCGKSKLAQAVAYELYQEDYRSMYFEWNITSASKAKDGLYEYDAIQRLGDSQTMAVDINKKNYIYDRALGAAIKKSVAPDRRAILLIDEIDKADIDFPNDLLNEIDKASYLVKETGEVVKASYKPIIFITSNAEKNLSDAFLRRCLFHYIEPLSDTILKEIINRRFFNNEPNKKEIALIEIAVVQFVQIRAELKKVLGEKNVSTSELLDWFAALNYYHKNTKGKDKVTGKMIGELTALGKNIHDIPFKQALFKNWNSLMHFENLKKKSEITS